MKIAVIGSGISGLGSSLLLSQKHDVHLFESDARLGGHAHTSNINNEGDSFNVDTGFLVYNDLTYPHLRSMFRYLGVETVESDMSLSVQVPSVGLEWAGDSLNTVFAQRRNLFNFKFYRLVMDILKFHRRAEENRELARKNQWTIGQLLKNMKYSDELLEWYVMPMVAAIWSTPEKAMLDFPAETFLTFFINHKLLQVNNRPKWKTVRDGSHNYVNKIASRLRNIHLSEAVFKVERLGQQLSLISNRQKYLFDKVIFATHAPLTSKILHTSSSEVRRILNSFKTEANSAFLHRDNSLMPRSKKCWASWNVQARMQNPDLQKVSLTYYLNRLQPLKTKSNILLTLNPIAQPDNKLLQAEYDHPVFDQKAIDAQKLIPQIQGHNGVYFAGAWTRYGFHEDGLLSAVKVAERFELNTPWIVD